MKATLCDRDKTAITGKPAWLDVKLVDGDGTVLFATKAPLDLCDDCTDTILGILRTRVVLKDSNLEAFTGAVAFKQTPTPLPTPKAAASPTAK